LASSVPLERSAGEPSCLQRSCLSRPAEHGRDDAARVGVGVACRRAAAGSRWRVDPRGSAGSSEAAVRG
jgi:hypothetical protein